MHIFTWGNRRREFPALAFDATGRRLAAGGGGDRTVLWDVATGAELAQYSAINTRSLCFAPVANRLVVPTHLGLGTYDLGEAAAFGTFARAKYVGALAVHPARDVAVCYHHFNNNRSALSALDLSTPEPAVLWDAPIGDASNETGHAVGLAAPRGGEWFVSAECVTGPTRSTRYRVAARSWADGRLLRELSGPAFEYGDQLFGSRASASVVVQSGIWLRVQRGDDFGAAPQHLRNDGRKHFTGVAFHPSGRYLAATSNDETVKLYDTTTWDVARTFTWDIGRLRGVAFSRDGALAAVGSDTGKVVVWDVDE